MKTMKPAILFAALAAAGACSGTPARVQYGYAEAEEVDVAAKIPGRIIEMKVREGDSLRRGDLIAVLQSDDIRAKVEQAKAGLQAADAQLRLGLKGARDEEKSMAERQFNIARDNMEIVQRTYERVLKVFNDGGISAQEKDTAEFRWRISREQYEQAKSYLDMVNNGARKEQIEQLRAQVRAAAEKVKEAQSYQDETLIRAPLDGEVKEINGEVGEVVSAGFALVTMLEPGPYVVFNLRETDYRGLKLGDKLDVEIPALGRAGQIEVYYIAPLADFAKVEATQEKGSWDIKTFEVRGRLTAGESGLRPGMTVRIEW
ncbi:MAG TPA: biotin/lipoyl-binding protein [Candidatus Aminicenantes bacterium]|nr:biotin/lipoyl-binding protein [Candidatus Aminicenantes bacterium]HRY65423.1 biotin/lipoyl-binding protein [Candidatus Aminicenantes bacterium]HRZ72109.1 biotin/lipoyl-binding protein [Candidatus Aminicenantes bacterium]